MRLKRVLSNRKGIGLIAVLIAIGLLSTISLILYQIFGSQYRMLSMTLQKNRLLQLNERLKLEIDDPMACQALLGHNNGLFLNINQEQNVTIRTTIQNVPVTIGPGYVSSEGGFTVDRVVLRLREFVQYPDTTGVLQNRNMFLHFPVGNEWSKPLIKLKADLAIIPRDLLWNQANDAYRIPLYVKLRWGTATTEVPYNLGLCHGLESYAEACEISGGVFDSTGNSPLDYRCNPDLVCKTGPNGVNNCDSFNCPAPYVPLKIGSTIADKDGTFSEGTKKCICQWCNANRSLSAPGG